MPKAEIFILVLLALNGIVSYTGFVNPDFFEKYKFNVGAVLRKKEYIRFLSSAFLHVNWLHLGFNMITLVMFGALLEQIFGGWTLVTIYVVSLLAGDLLALFFRRHEPDYSAVGASGAVCGVMFACIAWNPSMEIAFLFIPYFFPAWIFAIVYLLYTMYGISSKRDNVGHEAHLGGALAGMVTMAILNPVVIQTYPKMFMLLSAPVILFLIIALKRPQWLSIELMPDKGKRKIDIDEEFAERKLNRQQELDRLLDKINQKGYDSLSAGEKKRLEELSNR